MKSIHSVTNYDVMEMEMEKESNKDNNVNDFISFLTML